MEVICLDTGILIEYYRKDDKSQSSLFSLAKNYAFTIPAIVKYEIFRGNVNKDDFWLKFFQFVDILPFDSKCAEIASEIYMELKGKNQIIGAEDILIAATAIRHNQKLATFNSKHFKRIDTLTIVSL